MNTNLFDHVNIDKSRTHVPDGLAEDYESACAAYDEAVAAAGYPDLQLLGIGNNGHIGFNEPDDHFSKGTHLVDLTESTIEANSRLFDSIDDVPRQAFSMGVQTIMFAKMILVAANGEKKAQAVHDMCFGPVSPSCPASILQLHPNTVLVADEAALSPVRRRARVKRAAFPYRRFWALRISGAPFLCVAGEWRWKSVGHTDAACLSDISPTANKQHIALRNITYQKTTKYCVWYEN